MESTSTSKAEGIKGAPQLWILPLLEVRIMNKLQVSASAQSPNGNYLVAGDDPDRSLMTLLGPQDRQV